jgi:hypothetical protein
MEGDRSAVTVDATALPGTAFAFKVGRTGIIRAGRGSSTIEWLTIAGNPLAASSINTDLVQSDLTGTALPASLKVAHVFSHDSARGVDVRNTAADMRSRRIAAEITDSEFSRGVQGIRVINFAQADRGEITVEMRGNYAHENVLGCIIENNQSSFASVAVRSYGDRFDDNGGGCEIDGALTQAKTGFANYSTTKFDAMGSEFTNNTRTQFFNNTGPSFALLGYGVLVEGAVVLSTGAANTASNDTVIVRLQDVEIAGNLYQVVAFGAVSLLDPPAPAGTNDHALIQLRGTTAAVDVVAVDSVPDDPTGTNKVTVVRIP